MSLLERTLATLRRHDLARPGDLLVVAVSGGPDSVALLDALHRLREELGVALHVAHVEHGFRGEESLADARFVEGLAGRLGLPCAVERVDVPALARRERLSAQDAARRARYAFLRDLAQRLGAAAVAVAHHADDQVETITQQWLRGAGPEGMAGMAYREGLVIRPLLDTTRREVLDYCRQRGLEFRQDSSNQDLHYPRNRLRHEVIPALEAVQPGFRAVVLRQAALWREQEAFLREEAQRAMRRLHERTAAGEDSLALEGFQQLAPALRRQVVREVLRQRRGHLLGIELKHVQAVLDLADRGSTGAAASLPGGLQALREPGRLVLTGAAPLPTFEPRELMAPGITPLPGTSQAIYANLLDLAAAPPPAQAGHRGGAGLIPYTDNPNGNVAYLDLDRLAQPLRVRPRRPGDRFQPLGMAHPRKLQDVMVDLKIPRRLRDRVPLVEAGDEIVWLGGYRISECAKIEPASRRFLVLRLEGADVF